MAVERGQLRPRARAQLPGHPDHGRRRAVRDRRVPARRGRDRRRERRDPVDLSNGRGRARRLRPESELGAGGVVLVRRGRRARLRRDSGLSSRRPRRSHGSSGPLLRRARGGGPQAGSRPARRPRPRRDRLQLTTGRLERRRRRRRRAAHRPRPGEPGERARVRAGLRRPHGGAPVDLPHDSAGGGARGRYLGGGLLALHGQRGRLAAVLGRRRARARVPPGRGRHRRLLRWSPLGRQPLHAEPRGPRRAHGGAAVALPDDPPRDLGLRPARAARARRRRGRRANRSGRGAGHEAGLRVRLRPRDRRARVADRGAAGAGQRRPRRAGVPDAALSHEATALRPAGPDGGRPHRLHARR